MAEQQQAETRKVKATEFEQQYNVWIKKYENGKIKRAMTPNTDERIMRVMERREDKSKLTTEELREFWKRQNEFIKGKEGKVEMIK